MSSDRAKNEQVLRQGTKQKLNTDIYGEEIAKDRKINIDDKSLEHQVGDMSRYNTKEFTNVPGLDNKNQSGMSSSKGMEDSSSGHKTAMGSMGEHAQGQMK